MALAANCRDVLTVQFLTSNSWVLFVWWTDAMLDRCNKLMPENWNLLKLNWNWCKLAFFKTYKWHQLHSRNKIRRAMGNGQVSILTHRMRRAFQSGKLSGFFAWGIDMECRIYCTCDPPSTKEANFPRSVSGTQHASNTLRAGYITPNGSIFWTFSQLLIFAIVTCLVQTIYKASQSIYHCLIPSLLLVISKLYNHLKVKTYLVVWLKRKSLKWFWILH